MAEPHNAVLFKEWLASHGGTFHPGVQYSLGMWCGWRSSSGLSILASEDVEPDATIVTCPFSIIITPVLSRRALLLILQDASVLERWTERQSIIVYICFHWIMGPEIVNYDTLVHAPYLDTLPSPGQLRTPLHFTREELHALRGTNLYGATTDRRRVWEAEWEQCRADVSAVNVGWGKRLTWERFLTASTYLSSRAFPSTLLSSNPSLVQQPDSYPVLIPGVDALNHARAQPVSWVVTRPSPADSDGNTISLVIHSASEAGAEIFNNYGAKPNSELLLGYGFTLPANPDDTIVLKIGGSGAVDDPAARHEVGRGARGAETVWAAIADAVRAQEADVEDEEMVGVSEWQVILDSADMLRSMTESLLARLPTAGGSVSESVPELGGSLRRDVAEMVGHYVSGQREVLQDLLQYANDRETDGIAMARREGVVIRSGEEDDDVSEL
ncbi:hypothetical protein BC827DRAFT_1260775 [Russula dissimulans]|nr:hypothetical protein BC827DRAFT_1260775 [Russula dissimulans]